MAKLSENLWAARIALEKHREPGDPSTVFLGELANLLEEHDITILVGLRIKLDRETKMRRARRVLRRLGLVA